MNIDWNSPLNVLFKKKSQVVSQLGQAGIHQLSDLLRILPKKYIIIPRPTAFSNAKEGNLFHGIGKIKSIKASPLYNRRGKNKVILYNLNITVEDQLSVELMTLQFFNTYPSIKAQLAKMNHITFFGEFQIYKDRPQIINPSYKECADLDEPLKWEESIDLQYPVINGVSSSKLFELIQKIPAHLWDMIPDSLPTNILSKRNLLSLDQAYQILHGKCHLGNMDLIEKAKTRLIYEEFFIDQLKFYARKKKVQSYNAPIIKAPPSILKELKALFPYQLTLGQNDCLIEILKDFEKNIPMMRMIQGDVGSGKTTVAIIAAALVIKQGLQVAFMCPTESLARQHFATLSKILSSSKVTVEIMLGSTKASNKKSILESLQNGKINMIVGTHSLIQENVHFQKAGLVIIDEQHKFGVRQRVELVDKNKGVHCLIMSATPIPRSLGLAQYGDLDISIIKDIPANRKGIQTRIISSETFEKFLVFMNTRISMGEQAYVVVPAIFQNEEQNFFALEEVYASFSKTFPKLNIQCLHGKLTSSDKEKVLFDFFQGTIEILISTSVIEVGIDVPNATIMAIINPERFGLSSLHQLRGRVGRGQRPGFCFLITDSKLPKASLERLKIIESTTDGFIVAQKDLEIRGEGEFFGTDQTGDNHQKRMASILKHPIILNQTKQDMIECIDRQYDFILSKIKAFEAHIFSTI